MDYIGLIGWNKICIINLKYDEIYECDKSSDEITVDELKEFIDNYNNNKLKLFIKSEERPANDEYPGCPGLTKIVANSFEEIVLDKNNEIFFDKYADWCGPCQNLAPKISLVAKILKNSAIKVCKIDCEMNYVDIKYFPEPGIPNMKFFPLGEDKEPIK